MRNNINEIATFGGGCFWCTHAVFEEVAGVDSVKSGYTGGTAPGKPTYREICSGLTGHAEVIQITFNPDKVSYKDLLLIFMTTHDPTTLNRQGADVGTQYRSVIYYHNTEQEVTAKAVLEELTPFYDTRTIVTEISPLGVYYDAEEYHQDYYRNNKTDGYCQAVITPKLNKLRKLHAAKLKENG